MPLDAHIAIVPRSLLWATELDVLPVDRVLVRREGYLAVRCPSNPDFYWGNLLLFDDPPEPGDGHRWERLFEHEFGGSTEVRHTTLAWDGGEGALGAARTEFPAPGYELVETVGLTATGEQLLPHPRANREVTVRPLALDADRELWDAVVEVQVAEREDGYDEAGYRTFRRRRLGEQRSLIRAAGGGWYVALDPSGEVVGSCGIVVTGKRGRFQAVDTAASHRRRGVCSRLLIDAAHHSGERYGAERFVIAADPGYHALGLYESLGFEATERVCGVCRRPPGSA